MTIADHGGFDLMLELATSGLARAIRGQIGPLSATAPVNTGGFRGDAMIAAAVTAVGVAPGERVSATLDLTGSRLQIAQTSAPLPAMTPSADFGRIELGGTVTVTDRIDAVGLSAVVDFAADGAGNPGVTVALDEGAFFGSPLVQAILIGTYLAYGEAAYWNARSAARQLALDTLDTNIRARLAAVPAMTLLTMSGAPPVPGGPSVGRLDLNTTAATLRLLLTLGGAPGDSRLITRSWFLTSPSSGTLLDTLVVVVSNPCLLRDFVRTGLIAGLGFPASGFVPLEPCFFVGTAMLAVPGVGTVTIGTLIAGIDEAGLLRINFTFSVPVSPGITINGSVSQGFAITAPVAGGTVTLTLTPSGAPAVSSRVDVAAWIYLAAAFGGPAVLLLLAAADAIADSIATGAISGALAGALPTITVPVALPAGAPALAFRLATATQGDAVTRTLRIGTLTLGPNPFRDHEVILQFV